MTGHNPLGLTKVSEPSMRYGALDRLPDFGSRTLELLLLSPNILETWYHILPEPPAFYRIF